MKLKATALNLQLVSSGPGLELRLAFQFWAPHRSRRSFKKEESEWDEEKTFTERFRT